ncbi:TPA: hypothetical protein ACGTPM_002963 [Salmonella enterica]
MGHRLVGLLPGCCVPESWPWAREYWKPSSPRRDQEKAAALILAEMERHDRATARKSDNNLS